MAYELTCDDIDAIAAREADSHSRSINVKRRRGKRPLWFLHVHTRGATLRVTWYAIDGSAYSCGVAL